MKEGQTSRSEHLQEGPACGQVAELSKYIGWNGYLRGTDGSDTFLFPVRLAERMSTPSEAAAGRLNPGYSTQALLIYLMNASIFELRKPEWKRHHSELTAYSPKKIAARLGYSIDTVRRAMKRLRERGIVWLDGDSKVRFDLALIWNLCAWNPDSEKPSAARAEMLERIVAMSCETCPEIIAEEQARCIRLILNPSCCVEMPLSFIDGPVSRGKRPDWALQQMYAHFIYKFMPWRDYKTNMLKQHFQGGSYQLHRRTMQRVLGCGNSKITERTRQLADGGYIFRLIHRGTRPLRTGEKPLIWKDKERFYHLASTSDTLLNVERYVGLCHAKKVDWAPDITKRHTSRLAEPHQQSRWKARKEIPMPKDGTLTYENIAAYLDGIAPIRSRRERFAELAEKTREALETFNLAPQHLGQLYTLYLNTPDIWYRRKDGLNEPIRFAAKWLTDQAGLATTLAFERDTACSRAAEARKAEIDAMAPHEIFEKATLVHDSDDWWYYRPDSDSASLIPINASQYVDEAEARQLLGYQLGVLSYEAVADLI